MVPTAASRAARCGTLGVAVPFCLEALVLSFMVSHPGRTQALTNSPGLIHTWRGDDGNAFYLDGSRAVQVPDTQGLDIPDGSPWTLEAWVFPTSSDEEHIAGKRGPCGAGDGFYQIAIGRDTPGKGMGVAQKHVPVYTWTHVALAMQRRHQALLREGQSAHPPVECAQWNSGGPAGYT